MGDPKKSPRPDDLLEDDGLLSSEDDEDPDTDAPEPKGTVLDDESTDDPPTDVDWTVPVGAPYTDGAPDEEPVDEPWLDGEDDLLESADYLDDEPGPEVDLEGSWEDLTGEDIGPLPAEEDDALDDAAWELLEAPGAVLPRGRVLVGYKEQVSLPDLGLSQLVARCDTGAASSLLHAQVIERVGDDLRLSVGGHEVVAPLVGDPGELAVRVQVTVAGVARPLRLVVAGPDADAELVLGRDALEGWFVVDVAQRFVHRR